MVIREHVVRKPAVAGRFYPLDARELDTVVRRYMDTAPATTQLMALKQVRAVIAPHAGYLCSGATAGASFRALQRGAAPAQPGEPQVVYLMGPAHWQPVHGVGLSRAEAFATPLGTVPVAREPNAQLLARRGQYNLADDAHTPEHALEVELPFLQVALGSFQIVPMLFDDRADPEAVAEDLYSLLAGRPGDLIVVSSDLSHYHPYQQGIILDHALLKAIATRDLPAVNTGEACGLLPIVVLMRLAERLHWTPHLLAYANSGDTCGSRREVVGYGAVAFTA